jgi:hypothetical protein
MSKYNFNIATSAEISADTIEKMVKQVVEEQTGRRVLSVTFKTRKVCYGYGRDEWDESVFSGCTVQFAE